MTTITPETDAPDSAVAGSDQRPPRADDETLRPVSVTADRERMRLRLADGRRGPMRHLAMAGTSLRHLGSAEAAQNGLRYRPVAWTFITIVALAFYLPGRIDGPAVPQPVASPSPVVTAEPTENAAAEPAEQPPVSSPDFTPVAPAPTFTPAPTSPPPADGDPSAAPPTAPVDVEESASPLSVRGWAWASRLPATPLPTDAVADDTVPVSNRLGAVDRVAFVRLAGDERALTLVEHSDSSREALGPGMVAICPVLDGGWQEGPAQSFDDAPAWDTEACIGGEEKDDTWTFDLSGFTDRDSDAGFALVPTVDAPADFQVAFEVPGD